MLPFGQPVTLVKRVKGPPDGYGNDTWSAAETIVRGGFYPGQSSEFVQGQDLLYVQPVVYFPPGVDLAAVDAVRIDGHLYEVDGVPSVWHNPLNGANPGVEVHLKRVTG